MTPDTTVIRYGLEEWHKRHSAALKKIKYIEEKALSIDDAVLVNVAYNDDDETLLIHLHKGDLVARHRTGVEDPEWKLDLAVKDMITKIYLTEAL